MRRYTAASMEPLVFEFTCARRTPPLLATSRLLAALTLGMINKHLAYNFPPLYTDHTSDDCLEELRREAGLPQWPRWRLSDPNHGHASAVDAARQNLVLRVWMEKMRAALAYL